MAENLQIKLQQRATVPANNFNAVIKKQMADIFPTIKTIVPKTMTPERLMRISLSTVSRNPKLAQCTPESIVGAVVNCASLGLEPNLIGHAYLVPFKNNQTKQMECQFQIGYKGYLDLIRRTGDVSQITAENVYENDVFVYLKGTVNELIHIPFDMLDYLDELSAGQSEMMGKLVIAAAKKIKSKSPKDQGKVIKYYATYKMKDGSFGFSVLTKEQAHEHAMKFSKSKYEGKLTGPWKDHFDSMAKKTAIKEMIKYMPISIELQEKLAADEAVVKPKKDNGIESDDVLDVSFTVVNESDDENPNNPEQSDSAVESESNAVTFDQNKLDFE